METEGDFGWALSVLKRGGAVRRLRWNGQGMHLQWVPQQATTSAYIALWTTDGEYVPWSASQKDMLGEDWVRA